MIFQLQKTDNNGQLSVYALARYAPQEFNSASIKRKRSDQCIKPYRTRANPHLPKKMK